MKISINNRTIEVNRVAHREMGFGQAIGGPGVYSYSLAIPIAEALTKLSIPYLEIIRALKSDRPHRTPGRDPHLDRLAALHYPPWTGLVHDHPEIAEQLIGDWPVNMLEVLFPDTASPHYVINSVRSVAIGENHVQIEGDGFAPSER